MNVIIQSVGFKASTELETLVNEKLQKLEPIAHGLIRADVTLFQETEATENSYCEIRLEMPGNDPFVKKHAASFEQSIAQAVDALQTILRKNKEKITDHQQAGSKELL